MRRYWKDVVIAVLLVALGVLLVREVRHKAGNPTPEQAKARMDTLRMARSFDSLGYVIFDLSNELHSRTTGAVLKEPFGPRPGPEKGVGLPVPVKPEIPAPTPQQLAMAANAAGPSPGRNISVTFHGRDVQERAADWFRANGFMLRDLTDTNTDTATNALSYGDSVPWTVVQLTALELAQRRIQLRRIRRSSRPGEGSVIRLESLTHLQDVTPLSADQLLRLRPAPAPPAR